MNRILLLLLSLALSLTPALCHAAELNADQTKAIAEIKKLGGDVTRDEKIPDKPAISVNLNNTRGNRRGAGMP